MDELLKALDASPLALRRDACGDYRINGKTGHIYADGDGYLLCVMTDEFKGRWTNVKKRLAFCSLRRMATTRAACTWIGSQHWLRRI